MQTHVQGVIQKQPDCVRIFFTLYDYEIKLSANKPLFMLDLRPKNYIFQKKIQWTFYALLSNPLTL